MTSTPKQLSGKSYYTYLLRCSNNALYCGITNNLDRRIYQHNFTKLSAAYTRAHRPVSLVYFKKFKSRSLAQIREAQIKKLSKFQKEKLVKAMSTPASFSPKSPRNTF